MQKKGFTLIEIMIVLAIVGVITALTMGFGGTRIKQLKHQSAKALFVNTFEQLRSSALTSSFHNKTSFEKFSIQLHEHSNNLVYSYYFDNATDDGYFVEYQERIDPDISLENIRKVGEDENLAYAILDIKPYELSCNFRFTEDSEENNDENNNENKISFELQIKNSNKRYCFTSSSTNCRIVETKCPDNF